MEVTLIKHDSMYAMYKAAGVCRNSANTTSALEQSIQLGHDSIIEHCSITYAIKGISRACSHQLVRHRIVSYAQQSQRHVVIDDALEWFVCPTSINYEDFKEHMNSVINFYNKLIDRGIEPEDARYVLPNACKTDLVMTINLRSLLNLFNHRICNRAQWEICNLANTMYKLLKPYYPVVFKYNTYPNCFHCLNKCFKPLKGKI